MKVTIKFWRRLLNMHEDMKGSPFYRDVKQLVDYSEKELREELKNIPAGERHLRFTAGYIHALEKIQGEK